MTTFLSKAIREAAKATREASVLGPKFEHILMRRVQNRYKGGPDSGSNDDDIQRIISQQIDWLSAWILQIYLVPAVKSLPSEWRGKVVNDFWLNIKNNDSFNPVGCIGTALKEKLYKHMCGLYRNKEHEEYRDLIHGGMTNHIEEGDEVLGSHHRPIPDRIHSPRETPIDPADHRKSSIISNDINQNRFITDIPGVSDLADKWFSDMENDYVKPMDEVEAIKVQYKSDWLRRFAIASPLRNCDNDHVRKVGERILPIYNYGEIMLDDLKAWTLFEGFSVALEIQRQIIYEAEVEDSNHIEIAARCRINTLKVSKIISRFKLACDERLSLLMATLGYIWTPPENAEKRKNRYNVKHILAAAGFCSPYHAPVWALKAGIVAAEAG